MAKSTGIVVTAGALSLVDVILTDWQPLTALRITVATTLAALVSAGLDHVMPGLGTGLGVILLLTVVLTSGARIANKIKTFT